MAQRRINRKNLEGHYFKGLHENIPEEIEEEEEADREDDDKAKLNRAFLKKPNDGASVEVTVKVKKRRDRDKKDDNGRRKPLLSEREFCKGSWGDLLSNSKTSLACKDLKLDKRSKDSSSSKSKSPREECDGHKDHSPLCQKIPISDDFYLETHTHIRKSHSADADIKSTGSRSTRTTATLRNRALVKENEELKDQVNRLLREIEVTRSRPRPQRSVSRASSSNRKDYQSKDSGEDELDNLRKRSKASAQQSTQTSTTCLKSATTSPKKKTSESDEVVDLRTPPQKLSAAVSTNTGGSSSSTSAPQISSESAGVHVANMRLEKENEALRFEAGKLVAEMNRARAEYLECCNTMKELHNIAEVLKRDNFSLLQKHQHQQSLEGKLIQALAENKEMKDILESLAAKQKTSHGLQDEQLNKIRNVIKDVKMSIAQEMHVLKQPGSKAINLDSNLEFGDHEFSLNDTNASEIQRILLEPPEIPRGSSNLVEADRSSSTQYLTLGGLGPSPLAVSKYSPRVSTPNNSSDQSLSLSETGEGNFIPVLPPPVNSNFGTGDNDEWSKLQEQVARSYIPGTLRNKGSGGSTSSYSSASSSPNKFCSK